jgi:hypothetical protein
MRPWLPCRQYNEELYLSSLKSSLKKISEADLTPGFTLKPCSDNEFV